jgi:NAD(P)H-flavin reductase
MSGLHDAVVVSIQPAAEGLVSLRLDVSGTPLPAEFRTPGQYVKLAVEGVGESYFAIASAPEPTRSVLEFLLKTGSPLPDALAKLAPGSQVRISQPQGTGFPLEKAQGRRLLLFATGSGISPIRSTVSALLKRPRDFKSVTLYFGVRTPDAFAFSDELSAWEQAGIRVIRTVSRPGSSGWQGLTGYVQSHVGEERLEDAVAFLCGQKEMVRSVTETLVARGLPKENIFLNF